MRIPRFDNMLDHDMLATPSAARTPVVDIDKLIQMDPEQIDILCKALRLRGFVSVSFSRLDVGGIFRNARSIFDLPAETKLADLGMRYPNTVGYSRFVHALGSDDHIESYSFGLEPSAAPSRENYLLGTLGLQYEEVAAYLAALENRWPPIEAESSLLKTAKDRAVIGDEVSIANSRGFRKSMIRQYDACSEVVWATLQGLAVGMGQKPLLFAEAHAIGDHLFEFKRYPPLHGQAGKVPGVAGSQADVEDDHVTRVAHHTDLTSLTLLFQYGRGLQYYIPRSRAEGFNVVEDLALEAAVAAGATPDEIAALDPADGVWVEPEPGFPVLHVGEMLRRWTGGRCMPGFHRVVSDEASADTRVVAARAASEAAAVGRTADDEFLHGDGSSQPQAAASDKVPAEKPRGRTTAYDARMSAVFFAFPAWQTHVAAAPPVEGGFAGPAMDGATTDGDFIVGDLMPALVQEGGQGRTAMGHGLRHPTFASALQPPQ